MNLAISSVDVMSFEESTNHLNRHPNITFAFDRHYRLSRSKTPCLVEKQDDEDEREREKESEEKMLMKRMMATSFNEE